VIRTRDHGCARIQEVSGYIQSEAVDVNQQGVVVGTTDRKGEHGLEPRAFIYEKGKMRLIDEGGPNFTSANAINNARQVTGTFERDEDEEK
jgi:hypothetical protein